MSGVDLADNATAIFKALASVGALLKQLRNHPCNNAEKGGGGDGEKDRNTAPVPSENFISRPLIWSSLFHRRG